MNLVKDKRLRESVINRTEVLDRVKQLILLPNTEYATTRMVAEYYEVTTDVIGMIVMANNDEVISDGYSTISGKELVSKINLETKTETKRGHYLVDGIKIPYSKQGVFTRRAILRVGMLLRDSEVAKEVRTYLLNVEHDTQEKTPEIIENITEEINEEQKLLMNIGIAFASGDNTQILLATQAHHNYVVALKDKRIKKVEDEKEMIITNALTISESRKIIKAIVTNIATKTKRCYPEVWNEMYRKLNYQLSININGRNGKGSKLDKLNDEEMLACERMCRSWAMDLGLDLEKILKLK